VGFRERAAAAAAAMEEQQQSMSNAIRYSDVYQDSKYEYRHIVVPLEMVKLLDSICGGSRRLLEQREWSLVLKQDSSWEHYAMHRPEPHVLLFRRPIENRDQVSKAGEMDAGATSGDSNREISDMHDGNANTDGNANASANASSQNSNPSSQGGVQNASVDSPSKGHALADWHRPLRRSVGADRSHVLLRAPMKRHGRRQDRAVCRANSVSPRRLQFADEEAMSPGVSDNCTEIGFAALSGQPSSSSLGSVAHIAGFEEAVRS